MYIDAKNAILFELLIILDQGINNMPDVTMCQDDKCPQCNECYLFMAMPSKYRQSYFAESPRKGNKCEYFCEIKKGQKLNDST